jgi:hypothetical protein
LNVNFSSHLPDQKMKVLCLVLLAASAAVTDARPNAKAQFGGYPGISFHLIF